MSKEKVRKKTERDEVEKVKRELHELLRKIRSTRRRYRELLLERRRRLLEGW